MNEMIQEDIRLEIFGPANKNWRPLLDNPCSNNFRLAQELASFGRNIEAINLAQDQYIALHGDMHGVSFRVVTTIRKVTFVGEFSEAMWLR